MRWVTVERTATGYLLDPNPYLDRLPGFRDELPPGARAFATYPEHYDFRSERCVKDLRLISLVADGAARSDELVARFGFNDVAPEQLVVRYHGVSALLVEADPDRPADGEPRGLADRLGPVQLDEVLPHERGCRHDIKLISGTVRIVCADLRGEWVRAT